MTFREKIADFKAMLENEPHPMPDDWAPDFHVEGDKCIAYARVRGVGEVGLGFVMSENREANGRNVIQLIRTVWYGLELARLGRTDEFKTLGLEPFQDGPGDVT